MLVLIVQNLPDFLEKLKSLLQSKELRVGLKEDGIKRFVLHRNYGDKIESEFNLTRQGIRWRFKRIFDEIYVNSYLAIFWIESNFGTQLRKMAMEVARERVEQRKKAQKMEDFRFCRREKRSSDTKSERP